jgi:hypothetical protein
MASKCLFAEATLKGAPEIIRHYQEISARFPPTPDVLLRQLYSVLSHGCALSIRQVLLCPNFLCNDSSDYRYKNAHKISQKKISI